MRHLPTKPCEKCGDPTELRIRRVRKWWQWPTKWHWYCVWCSPAYMETEAKAETPKHVLQEYNTYGNDCHFPGCKLTADQHPKEV